MTKNGTRNQNEVKKKRTRIQVNSLDAHINAACMQIKYYTKPISFNKHHRNAAGKMEGTQKAHTNTLCETHTNQIAIIRLIYG